PYSGSSSLFREIQDEELKKFCSRISKLLQAEDLGPDTLDSLQRLFLIISATKYNRRVIEMRRSVLWARACCEHWRAGSLRGPASDTSSPSWPRSWSSARAPSRRTRPPCSASGWSTGCATLASSKGSRTPAASSPHPGPGR
uniref:Adaptor related protein complex 5 subunit zeta 1 n=1 Tax=Macaca fascicularis TaxID=9541 RepID=A0A7N9CY57_MACFA